VIRSWFHQPRGLRRGSFTCWKCGFEYYRGHRCLSVMRVVRCQVEVSSSGWSLVQRSPTECSVSECDIETSILRHRFTGGCFACISLNTTCLFLYLLTPWSSFLLENSTSSQLFKKFPTFHGTWRFITTFTRVRHLTLYVNIPQHDTFYYGENLLALSPTPKLENHPLSAVCDCLFNIFAATLHIGCRSFIRNLRTRHAVMTGTLYRGADKSLARPGRKWATATEDFDFNISYL